ncbi:hypothetical protein COL75_15485 [Bacillus wiedmannii]|uniref:Eco57I restriction-modification methylase domain-containing protein n=1 Tax=Bacillus TaxID=1386 RepID=UPI000BF7E21A|nr:MULTISPECIES: Eco57I restriction-modification methylase domain-containing protein [Bacillus]PFZ02652.1 hypothetical protein COL75_15485 [Bacillus wiedmannii]
MLINQLYDTTLQYSNTVTKANRKKIGQFFTPPSVADYMGQLMQTNQKEIRVLDAGAGTGMLGGSICQHAFNNKDIEAIHVDFYDTDENIIPFLNQNIELMRQDAEKKGKKFTYNIIQENFILYNETIWQDNFCIEEKDKYDVIIGNPPYKKIGKSVEEAVVMSSIVYGQPNTYFLFMAMSTALLKEQGEMIYIVPRSFTSGLYFKKFREYFLNTVKLTHLHLFHSRSDVFDNDKILQEAIILRAVKTNETTDSIHISSSENMFIENSFVHQVPYNTVVDMNSENFFMLIPTSIKEVELLSLVHSWENNLINLGFKLKTGPVVDFRSLDLIQENEEENTVPLLWANHFKNNKILFPLSTSKNPQFIVDTPESKSVLLPNKNYLLIKRFTSKEEKRRVQCALYLKDEFLIDKIGIENHINYVTKLKGEMTKEELYGLYVLFNSTYIDSYYRILNGSTQVNATEVNSIPLPPLNTIKILGKSLIEMEIDFISTEICDVIIGEIFINNRLEKSKK